MVAVDPVQSLLVFVVSLLIGAFGIYVGGRVITNVEDYSHAIITALIGAIVWMIVGWIPLVGFILALLAYIAVVNWRYPGGWVDATLIALIAWIAALVVLYVLALFNVTAFEAFGVPGV